MSKKQLYFIIVLLGVIVLYLLFVPAKDAVVPVVDAPMATSTEEVPHPASSTPTPVAEKVETPVTIEGMFLGLKEEQTEFQKSFFYMLLDDGTEVVRIDLRPLLGYSIIDPVGKLGVDRGVRVKVSGTMQDGQFVIAKITKSE